MANSSNQAPVTVEELLVSSLAQTDALAKLLIEKGIITQQDFSRRFQKSEGHIRPCSSRHHTDADEPGAVELTRDNREQRPYGQARYGPV